MRLAAIVLLAAGAAAAAEFSPKYAPEDKPVATPLKRAPAHVRSAPAPDFWALIPYYEGMRGPHSASAASAAMVLNALRQDTRYSSSDELIGEGALPGWTDRLRGDKPAPLSLAEFASLFEAAASTFAEPYWVSLDAFVKALSSLRDAAGKPAGGLVRIEAKRP